MYRFGSRHHSFDKALERRKMGVVYVCRHRRFQFARATLPFLYWLTILRSYRFRTSHNVDSWDSTFSQRNLSLNKKTKCISSHLSIDSHFFQQTKNITAESKELIRIVKE